MSSLFPTINSRYRLLAQLGEGAMGVVYHAADRLSDQMVALKHVTFASSKGDKQAIAAERIRRGLMSEFRTLASLHHPNIIAVRDYGFDPQQRPYFTMDLLEGTQSIIQAGLGQPLDEKVRLLTELLQALSYIHRRGIIHRDLKPPNVLVDRAGRVKVLDFGLSLRQGVNTSSNNRDKIAGTLAFIAPEVFTGEGVSPQSDLYSFGIIAYELLTERFPFDINVHVGVLIHSILNIMPSFDGIDEPVANLLRRLLAKSAGDRYWNAEETLNALCAATGQPHPRESIDVRESFLQAAEFVGRGDELGQLAEALNTARQGQGSIWLIGGESGVGKSRLIEETRVQAIIQGALVLRGQGIAEGGVPYQLWREPARWLALVTELTDLEAGILMALVPDIEQLLERKITPAPALDERRSLRRLAATLIALLRRQKQPVVLILEDLHWAVESLEILKMLVNVILELPVLIIGSYRSDERPDLPTEIPAANTLPLARLSESDIRVLSEQMLGENGSLPEIVSLIHRESEGNAFFIVEVVRTLAEEAGSLSNIGRTTLPEAVFAGGMQTVLQRRLRRVPPNAYALLKLAAVAGRELDLKLLRLLIQSLPSPDKNETGTLVLDLDTWLRTCANAAVLELEDGRWRFAHDKLREATISEIEADERITLNRQVAEALEALYSEEEQRTRLAYTLADHWHAAQNAQKAAYFATLACQQYLMVGNSLAAAALAERALAAGGDTKDLIALHRQSVRAQRQTGGLALGIEHANAGLALARATGDLMEERKLLQELSNIALNTGDYTLAQESAERGIALAQSLGDEEGYSDMLISLGMVYGWRGDHLAARRHFEQSLVIQRKINSTRGIAINLNNLGVAAHYVGEFAAARTYYEQALEIDEKAGDLHGVALVLGNMAGALEGLGDYETAKTHYERSLKLRRELGDRAGIIHALNSLGWNRLRSCDAEGAKEHQEQALGMAEMIGDRRQVGLAHRDLAFAQILMGEFEQARVHTEAAEKVFMEIDDSFNHIKCYANYSLIAFTQGAHETTLEHTERGLALCRAIDNHLLAFNLNQITAFAQAALGRNDAMRETLRAMFAYSQEHTDTPTALELLLTYARWLALEGQLTRSAELCGMIAAHPAKDGEMELLWLPQIIGGPLVEMPFDDYDAAFVRGAGYDFEAAKRELAETIAAF